MEEANSVSKYSLNHLKRKKAKTKPARGATKYIIEEKGPKGKNHPITGILRKPDNAVEERQVPLPHRFVQAPPKNQIRTKEIMSQTTTSTKNCFSKILTKQTPLN